MAAGSAPASAAVPRDFVGVVADDVLVADPGPRDAQLSAQQNAGIGLLRVTFNWDKIEVDPGKYDFSFYDDYVADLARHGIRALPIIFAPPTFRSGAPPDYTDRYVYPPRSNAEMGDFAQVLVRRYGPRGTFWSSHPNVPFLPVRAWQIWNEPNLRYYWPSGPNAREYTDMLATVGPAINAVDPRAEIVTAGLPDSDQGIAQLEFIKAMYKAGARSYFDTLAVNLYGQPDEILEQITLVRKLMRENRHRRAKIWLTETGWATGGPKGTFSVDEAGQAKLVKEIVKDVAAARRKLGLRGIVYFNWRDLPPYNGRSDFWGLHTGLLDANGTPKPALNALAGAISTLK